MGEKKLSRRELVAKRFKPLLARLPVREPVEGVQPLNPGYFHAEHFRSEARPKLHSARRTRMVGK